MEHDGCILNPYEEQVHDNFEEALTMVDKDCVVGHWLGDLGGISPNICYHEVSQYLNPSYRLEEWRDAEWKSDVKEKLLALEHHPH